MESQEYLWAGDPSYVLETWLATQASKVPYEGEVWVWANPQASPLSRATFWRALSAVVTRCKLERVRTRVGTPGGVVTATLVRGLMHACAPAWNMAQLEASARLPGTYGSISINEEDKYQKIQNSISSVRFAHKKENSRKIQGKSSGEFEMSESAQEKAAKWQKLQSKGEEGPIAESISTLITGKLTKPRLADLWKLLFCTYQEEYAKNLGLKERNSLFAWKKEFYEHFPPDILFGEFLRDVHKDYQQVKAYVIQHTSFKDGPDLPEVYWLYTHRDFVVKWWLDGAKENKFKGATLS